MSDAAREFLDAILATPGMIPLDPDLCEQVLVGLRSPATSLSLATQLLQLTQKRATLRWGGERAVLYRNGNLFYFADRTHQVVVGRQYYDIPEQVQVSRLALTDDAVPFWHESASGVGEWVNVAGTRGEIYPFRAITNLHCVANQPFYVVTLEDEEQRLIMFAVYGAEKGIHYRDISQLCVIEGDYYFRARRRDRYEMTLVRRGQEVWSGYHVGPLLPYREGVVAVVQETDESAHQLLYLTADTQQVLTMAPRIESPVLVDVDGVLELVWAERQENGSYKVLVGEEKVQWWSGSDVRFWSGYNTSDIGPIVAYSTRNAQEGSWLCINDRVVLYLENDRHPTYVTRRENILKFHFEDGQEPRMIPFDLAALGLVSASSSLSP